ncbi:DYRK2 Dual specificity tyrosine-phosphorylation-regulated kinase 2 [Candida maltosa Xu316]|uniref:Protein kinase, putative n=1 Tax=Candida maltosa (strain Xu316) TaxID=1245528 RepID=M3JBP4_CANMX|nr:Protein kinase, putative [Candida maltosa Xu316]
MSRENIALFESEFSQIHLNHRNNLDKKLSPTKRKKALYPQHLYPSNNITPNLNAEVSNGNVSNTKPNALKPPPTTPNRITSHSSTAKERFASNQRTPTSNSTRAMSCPSTTDRKQDYPFSFMKETTSSIQRKQVTPLNTKIRMVSKSPTATSATKKRLEYSRQLSQKSKRYISNNISKNPSDIFNGNDQHEYDNYKQNQYRAHDTSPTKYSRLNELKIDDSPTKQRRIPTQPPPELPNVFHRLYPQKTPTAFSTTSKPKSTTSTRNYSQAQIMAPKVETINELYNIIYSKNPGLFAQLPPSQEESMSYDLQSLPLENLNMYERGEITRIKEVYYIPDRSLRNINISNHGSNFGFDDMYGNYIIIPQDHINYRYEIVSNLGTGSFGNVVMAKDHKSQQLVAVKIINNHINFSIKQSMNEMRMLKILQEKQSTNNESKIMTVFNHFNFRSHMCIATELLSINLYSLLELTNFKGFGYPLIQNIAKQVLMGLKAVHDSNIIHCDIKPENVMLKLPSSPDSGELLVKIIDFGSSCLANETSFTYIQSRFYRAPEILIGGNYDTKIDIWSVGCLLVELFSGIPLLPGKNEYDQVGLILELFGAPKPATVIRMRHKLMKRSNQRGMNINDPLSSVSMSSDKGLKRTLLYKVFDHNGKINLLNLQQYCHDSSTTPVKKVFKVASKTLEFEMGLNRYSLSAIEKQKLLSFLHKTFVWDPSERSSAQELLNSDFLA